jgi:DNA repair exonuclease SbcCD nuclease subunit
MWYNELAMSQLDGSVQSFSHARGVRLLLVADTHLGFDLPFHPRIERRRRGYDFFDNFERALRPAHNGEVDLVVHGGDLFFRSRVPAGLVEMAMAPLVQVADCGVPVYLVPGNHERSTIPLHLWTAHPNIHIFDRPRTFVYEGPRASIALAGFPFSRGIRKRFPSLLSQTRYQEARADLQLLCMHQTVEGARVGAGNFVFRRGPDVVPGRELPPDCDAVLSGHIHRAQVLTHDLSGRPLAAPVIYPGAVERTSFAERTEDKGYMLLTFVSRARSHDDRLRVSFRALPARPMVSLLFEPENLDSGLLKDHLVEKLKGLDPDAIVRIQLRGPNAERVRELLSANALRELAPATMNIDLSRHGPRGQKHLKGAGRRLS